MPESTAKKNLLNEQEFLLTPQKVFVQCQINGWMQTNVKAQKQNKCSQPFRVHKKFPSKSVYSTPTTLDSLKQHKDKLMESSLNKKIFHGQEKTKAHSNSNDHHTLNSKSTTRNQQKIVQKQLPIIRVNEFVADECENNNTNFIPFLQPFIRSRMHKNINNKFHDRNTLISQRLSGNQTPVLTNARKRSVKSMKLLKNNHHPNHSHVDNSKNKLISFRHMQVDSKSETINDLNTKILKQHNLCQVYRMNRRKQSILAQMQIPLPVQVSVQMQMKKYKNSN